MFENRLENLRKEFLNTGAEVFLIGSGVNMGYLSGFQGNSGWLLITQAQAYLITDFRFAIQAKVEAPDFSVIIYQGSILAALKELLSSENIHELGFESEFFTYDQFEKFNSELQGVHLIPLSSIVEKLRSRKDSSEIQLIRKAVGIADEAFEHVLGYIKLGVRECELAAELEYFMRKKGASKPSFDTIVGTGSRGALPHGTASNRAVERGDLIVIDFGAIFQGYCSDITRTVVAGEASQEQKKIYNIVLEAQKEATAAVEPGKKCSEVDAVARSIIASQGYGDNFGHGLGHGVGREVHESPSVNSRNQDELAEGMVVTVEPGIYLDDWGGVRIEDMVLLTSGGCEILTQARKGLVEVS